MNTRPSIATIARWFGWHSRQARSQSAALARIASWNFSRWERSPASWGMPTSRRTRLAKPRSCRLVGPSGVQSSQARPNRAVVATSVFGSVPVPGWRAIVTCRPAEPASATISTTQIDPGPRRASLASSFPCAGNHRTGPQTNGARPLSSGDLARIDTVYGPRSSASASSSNRPPAATVLTWVMARSVGGKESTSADSNGSLANTVSQRGGGSKLASPLGAAVALTPQAQMRTTTRRP